MIFVAFEWLSAQTDLEVYTPWVCHWARSPLGRRGGISHSAGTGPVGTACTYHCSHRPRNLLDILQRQHRCVYLSLWKQNSTQKSTGILTGSAFPLCFVAGKPLRAGLLAFAQVKEESCSASRAEVLGEAGVTLWPALLTKKHRPTASVYLNHKLSSASCVLNIHGVTVLHVLLGTQLRVSDWCLMRLHTWFNLAPVWRNVQYERGISFFTCLSTCCVDTNVLQCHILKRFLSVQPLKMCL